MKNTAINASLCEHFAPVLFVLCRPVTIDAYSFIPQILRAGIRFMFRLFMSLN